MFRFRKSTASKAKKTHFDVEKTYVCGLKSLLPKDLAGSDALWSTSPSESLFFNNAREQPDETKIDVFVSHVWIDETFVESKGGDEKAKTFFFSMKSTGVLKGAEALAGRSLALAAKASDPLKLLSSREKEEWTYWVDHCCVNQGSLDHKIHTIEKFQELIQNSNSMIVLCSPSYFSRLWTLFEYSTFLAVKQKLDQVTLYTWAFMDGKKELIEVYKEGIKNLSVSKSKCLIESDREHLRKQVEKYFKSEPAFESFARFAAISMLIQSLLLSPAVFSQDRFEFFIQPFFSFGREELGLDELCDKFEAFDAIAVYESLQTKDSAERNPAYIEAVVSHVNTEIVPLMEHEASKALK